MSPRGHSSLSPTETTPVTAPGEEMAAANVLPPREWHDIIEAYVAAAHEDKSDLSALLIDIDALKAANDELGHDVGNQLIDTVNRLTSLIPQSVRNEHKSGRSPDLVMSHSSAPPKLDMPGVELPQPQAARIGGDEFGIILPDTDREGAHAVADRLRETLAEELKLPENHRLAEIGVGISIGVVALEPGMTTSDFLRLADHAMYADKLRQLRPLSKEEQVEFEAAIEHLEKAGVRPRDVPKYVQMLGASAVTHAFENQAIDQTDTDPVSPVGQTDQTGQVDS
jgi:GGDEF domain-containing protein